jgi:hypothetical protein
MDGSPQGVADRAEPRRRGLLALPTPREGLWLGVVLALMSALPFMVASQPMLTDYASHLARYHVMLDGGHSLFLARYYSFEWLFRGNLGADLLVWPLAKLFGIETAGWLIGFIIPPLTGLGLIAVDWQLRRRVGMGAWLAFATIWSPAMGMGFYNFCLSLALALFAFAGWIKLEGWKWRWALYLPIGLVVWLCHASGWGILGVLVFGYEFSRRKGLSAFINPWPLLLPLIPALLFAGEAKGGLSYGDRAGAYKFAIFVQTFRQQELGLDILTLALLVLIVLAAFFTRRIDGRLGWAALLLALLSLAMPRHFGGGDYADYRLIAVTLTIGCLAIAWQPPRWLFWAVPALFLYRLGVTTETWHRQSQEMEAALGALDRLPVGARVAGAVLVEPQSWSLNPFEHAPSYATVRRDALVNSHFAIPGVHMIKLRPEALRGKLADFIDPSQRIIHWRGKKIDLAHFKSAKQADYLWYFGRVRPDTLPAGAKVIYATRTSFLARLANPPRGS